MRRMTQSGYRPQDMINRPPAPPEWARRIVSGDGNVIKYFGKSARRALQSDPCRSFRIAIDAHLGVDWNRLIRALETVLRGEGLNPDVVDVATCLKDAGALNRMLKKYLPEDPTFGFLYDGSLMDFFDPVRIASLKERLKSMDSRGKGSRSPEILIVYGPGAAVQELRPFYDRVFYIDLTREEILKRMKAGLARPLGVKEDPGHGKFSESALPAYFSTRRFYYVDYPALDSHRKRLLPQVDDYLDGNAPGQLKLVPGDVFRDLMEALLRGPLKPKPYYDPSPWGGQWLKRVRRLPAEMKNCAWSYDLIEPETSFQVALGKHCLEIPFQALTGWAGKDLLGSKGSKRKFRGQFPIRINYDDSYEGGDMALQSHPPDAYIQARFGEPYRQDESYYIVDARAGSRVYLGLKEDADLRAFRQAVVRAEKDHIPFDHNQFVNSFPTQPGDLFLIPAGTLHGSGADNTVLEISATTYRYTFHFYDYLRPGLDGQLRAIHSKDAFAVLRPDRRTAWVKRNLIQSPRLLRSGRGWAEYLLGSRSDMFFKVHRFEFDSAIEDDTGGEFHLLIPVAGKGIRIIPEGDRDRESALPFSCLAVLPASMGRYRLESVLGEPCHVVKVLMR